MLLLQPAIEPGRPLKLLCLGAHSDDIEIGCGGTLIKLLTAHPGSALTWVVLSADDRREREARASAERYRALAGTADVIVERFRESYFPSQGEAIKGSFEGLKGTAPDLVFTHTRHDRHQDHRLVSDLTWNTFRNHLVLEYEIPKWDGDLATPNIYVQLDEEHVEWKVSWLLEDFSSQREKAWFDEDTFRGLMRIRGVESNARGRFAEGFYGRKIVIPK